MGDVRAALHRLQNLEVTRVPCCTPEVADKPCNKNVLFVDLTLLSKKIDAVIMSDRENIETGLAPHELYLKSNPGLLKIDVTNPREWYKNGEKILTTVYDKNLNHRSYKSNAKNSLDAGVKSNGGLLLPSVYDRRNEVSPDRSRNTQEKGRNGGSGSKVFPYLNHATAVRYTSEPSLNTVDLNENKDEVGNEPWTNNVKENIPEEDQLFEKRNGLPLLRNGGHISNGTVSDSEFEGVVFYQKKKQRDTTRRAFRGGGGKATGKANHLHPKQRSILHDTINFEQYKLKQKSILKLKFPEADPNQKPKPRPFMYNFQYSVPNEPDYSHIQSKIGSLIRPTNDKKVPNDETTSSRHPPEDAEIPDYSPRGFTPNAKYSFGLDILTSDEPPYPTSTPSVKEGHYVYKAPGDGFYQRSMPHDGNRTAIVNLALSKDIRSMPSEGMTTSLKGRYRRGRKADSGYTSSTPATEISSWDERSIIDYETDEESRSRGQSRANGAGTSNSKYSNLKSAGSFKSNLCVKDAENRKDNETNCNDSDGVQRDQESRLDSPSKKSVRFSHSEVKVDGLISPSKLGLPRTPGTAGSRPKSVLKKFNKIEVFGEKWNKKVHSDQPKSTEGSDETIVTSKPHFMPTTRPPMYRLDKSTNPDDSSSEKLNSKSGDEDDEYMTRVARLGSPTESKMVEIVESYRRYLDQGESEDPTPRTNADAKETEKKEYDTHEKGISRADKQRNATSKVQDEAEKDHAVENEIDEPTADTAWNNHVADNGMGELTTDTAENDYATEKRVGEPTTDTAPDNHVVENGNGEQTTDTAGNDHAAVNGIGEPTTDTAGNDHAAENGIGEPTTDITEVTDKEKVNNDEIAMLDTVDDEVDQQTTLETSNREAQIGDNVTGESNVPFVDEDAETSKENKQSGEQVITDEVEEDITDKSEKSDYLETGSVNEKNDISSDDKETQDEKMGESVDDEVIDETIDDNGNSDLHEKLSSAAETEEVMEDIESEGEEQKSATFEDANGNV